MLVKLGGDRDFVSAGGYLFCLSYDQQSLIFDPKNRSQKRRTIWVQYGLYIFLNYGLQCPYRYCNNEWGDTIYSLMMCKISWKRCCDYVGLNIGIFKWSIFKENLPSTQVHDFLLCCIGH